MNIEQIDQLGQSIAAHLYRLQSNDALWGYDEISAHTGYSVPTLRSMACRGKLPKQVAKGKFVAAEIKAHFRKKN